jgi:hypothetical protein
MRDHLPDASVVPGRTPTESLDVAQAVLRAGDGSLPELVGVGRGAPAFLLPRDPRVAASVCRAFNGLRPTRRRWQRAGVALALRAGGGSLVGSVAADRGLVLDGMPAGQGLLDELSDRLGRPLQAGVGLGVLDAYWKPVLQLFDAGGAAVGFAKVGWTPMTRRLVDTEWAMLSHVDRRLREPVVPRPLLRLEHGPLLVVVTAPLPLDSRRLPGAEAPEVPSAMAHLDGEQSAVLGDLDWWDAIRDAVRDAAAAGDQPSASTLPDLVTALESRWADATVEVGLVHGDWVPWNQARRRSTGELVVWDWEYAHPRAPLGLDAVHARYQSARLLHGLSDAEAFARAHASTEPLPAALHAALVAARRCRASLLGASDVATSDELAAATAALARALDHGGSTA